MYLNKIIPSTIYAELFVIYGDLKISIDVFDRLSGFIELKMIIKERYKEYSNTSKNFGVFEMVWFRDYHAPGIKKVKHVINNSDINIIFELETTNEKV